MSQFSSGLPSRTTTCFFPSRGSPPQKKTKREDAICCPLVVLREKPKTTDAACVTGPLPRRGRPGLRGAVHRAADGGPAEGHGGVQRLRGVGADDLHRAGRAWGAWGWGGSGGSGGSGGLGFLFFFCLCHSEPTDSWVKRARFRLFYKVASRVRGLRTFYFLGLDQFRGKQQVWGLFLANPLGK